MPSTKTLIPTSKFFSIFKGVPGTGKTRAAASFPKPYFFDTDGRLGIIKTIFPDKDVTYDSFYGNMDGFFRKLDLLNSHCPYETVVLDSLTSFARTTLSHMIKSRGGKGDLLRGGLRVPQIEDYGGETAALVLLTDGLRSLVEKGVKVILIAHVVEVDEKNIKTQVSTTVRQLLTGGKKIAAELPSYYDEVYHFAHRKGMDGKPEFYISTLNEGDDFAKTALNLPREITWTNKNFYDTWLEKVKELNPAVGGSSESKSVSVI